MMTKGKAPKTIHDVYGLMSAAMNTAEMLQYIPKNPCRGVQLPSIDKAEDEAIFLTHTEFNMILEVMGGECPRGQVVGGRDAVLLRQPASIGPAVP